MTRQRFLLALGLTLSPLLLGCEKDGGGRVEVNGSILPRAERLHYQTYVQVRGEKQQKASTIDLEIAMTESGRSMEFLVRTPTELMARSTDHKAAGELRGQQMTNEQGVPVRADFVAGQRETVDLLPRPDTTLEVGRSYETPVPVDWIVENSLNDQPTLYVHYVITPKRISQHPEGTVVRAETRGYYRMAYVDESGALRQGEVGYVGKGMIDMAAVPDEGWRVLRMAELSLRGSGELALAPREQWQGDEALSLGQLRAQAEQVGVLCLESGTVTPRALVESIDRSEEMPEFEVCGAGLAGGERAEIGGAR